MCCADPLCCHPSDFAPATRYAIPVSHSHQLLCVLLKPASTVVTNFGAAGSVTSQIWCDSLAPALPNARSRNQRPAVPLAEALGRVFPPHTLTICAPAAAKEPLIGAGPGMWNRNLGLRTLVTSMIEVPLDSDTPVSGLTAVPERLPL